VKRPAQFLSLLFLASLIACGGSNMAVKTGGPPIMSGNYNLTATSQTVSRPAFIAGALQSDPMGHVTATMQIINGNLQCFQATGVTFTGIVDSQGQLSLTSSSINGQTINITAMVSVDGNTISSGSYTTTGSGCFPTGTRALSPAPRFT
jgi:hypothetical protein